MVVFGWKTGFFNTLDQKACINNSEQQPTLGLAVHLYIDIKDGK
jgi:hypothetical protein